MEYLNIHFEQETLMGQPEFYTPRHGVVDLSRPSNDLQKANNPTLTPCVGRCVDSGMLPMQHTAWTLTAAANLGSKPDVVTFDVDESQVGQRMLMTRIGIRPKRLSLVGAQETGEPGDLAWASDAGLEKLACRLSHQPLAIVLPRVPANSPSIGALKRAFTRRGLVVVRGVEGTPFIDLDASWENPRLKFNAGRRSDFRRAERHAEKSGGLTFEIHENLSASALDSLLDEAYEVEARSWKGKIGTALTSDHILGSFFREYAHEAMRQGTLRLALMRIGGVAVGMQIAVQCLERFWLLKIGYDPSYARCSPGNLLMLHTIGYAAQRGLRSYEFLGSPAPWTTQWTQELRPYVSVNAYPASLQGASALVQDLFGLLRKALFTISAKAHLNDGILALITGDLSALHRL